MATTASHLAPREEQLALPIGALMNGVLIQVRRKMNARKAEEERLWRNLMILPPEEGENWLNANTDPC